MTKGISMQPNPIFTSVLQISSKLQKHILQTRNEIAQKDAQILSKYCNHLENSINYISVHLWQISCGMLWRITGTECSKGQTCE